MSAIDDFDDIKKQMERIKSARIADEVDAKPDTDTRQDKARKALYAMYGICTEDE